ncbi:MAG: type II secretion system protein [Lachnospiraceae bacterium]|nr:type II secretion system protein [Lachnospiraceae bacterium]
MRRERKIDNKGFSLVELIIVIAIMAILIGVMSPQLMKYVERARQSKDTQAVDSVHTAVVTAMLDPAVDDAPATAHYTSLAQLYADTTCPNFVLAVQEIANESVAANIEGSSFVSKAYNGLTIDINIANSKVTCTVGSLVID